MVTFVVGGDVGTTSLSYLLSSFGLRRRLVHWPVPKTLKESTRLARVARN